MAKTKLTKGQINNVAPLYRGQLTTAQNVTNALENNFNWDTDNYDPWNMHDPASNPEQIVVPEAGKYLVIFALCWSGGTGVTSAWAYLWRNASHQDILADTGFGSRQGLYGNCVIDCDAGDVIKLGVKFLGNTGTVSLRGNECGIEVVKIAE